jgi:isoquinoline 1-oxidoreductase beta subunit
LGLEFGTGLVDMTFEIANVQCTISTPRASSRRSSVRLVWEFSLAQHGEMSFKGGRVQQKNFDDPGGADDDAPIITSIHILPPFAPASINTIFAAKGKCMLALPIWNQLETSF